MRRNFFCVILVFSLPAMAAPSTDWAALQAAMSRIRSMEDRLPSPDAEVVIDVGTLHCSALRPFRDARALAGAFGPPTILPKLGECHHAPGATTCEWGDMPALELYAKKVRLRFAIDGSCGRFRFNNVDAQTPSPRTYEVVLTKSNLINWTFLRSSDETPFGLPGIDIHLTRYPIGGGAFTVPMIPTGILYAPLRDTNGRNEIRFIETQWSGCSTRVSFSNNKSVTTPGPPSTLTTLSKIASVASTVTGKIKFLKEASPALGAIASGLNVLQSAIGSIDVSHTAADIETYEQELRTRSGYSYGHGVGAEAGLGGGDLIFWLSNVEAVWVSDGENLSWAIAGYESIASAPVLALRTTRAIRLSQPLPSACGTIAHLAPVCASYSAATLTTKQMEALLALDPFQGGVPLNPAATLSHLGDRFVMVRTEPEMTDGASTIRRYTQEVSRASIHSVAHSDSEITAAHPGFLSMFGVGPEREETVTATMTHGSLHASEGGHTVEMEIVTYPKTPSYTIFFDRLFGSYLTVPQRTIATHGNEGGMY